MPLLEYRCRTCGAIFERLVPRVEGADTAPCEGCGAADGGRRVLSVFATVRGGDGVTTASAARAAGGCCGGGGCGI